LEDGGEEEKDDDRKFTGVGVKNLGRVVKEVEREPRILATFVGFFCAL